MCRKQFRSSESEQQQQKKIKNQSEANKKSNQIQSRIKKPKIMIKNYDEKLR